MRFTGVSVRAGRLPLARQMLSSVGSRTQRCPVRGCERGPRPGIPVSASFRVTQWGDNEQISLSVSRDAPLGLVGMANPFAASTPGASNPFGTPAAPTTASLFGAATPAAGAGGSLFGSITPAAKPAGGLFGAAPATGGGLFGAAPAAAGGLFGAMPAAATPGTSLLGGGGLFGAAPAPAAGGLFGAAPAAAGGGLFGAPAPAMGGGLFGAPAPAQQQPAPQAAAAAPLDQEIFSQFLQQMEVASTCPSPSLSPRRSLALALGLSLSLSPSPS